MIMLIDVRDKSEYEAGHAEGAVHLPVLAIMYGNLGILAETDKHTPLEVYCHSGGRAEKAKQLLTDLGFTHVINRGGLNDVLAGMPLPKKTSWFIRIWQKIF